MPLAAALVGLLLAAPAALASGSSTSILVLRIGDGTATLSTTFTSAVFLDEFDASSPSAASIPRTGSFPMPNGPGFPTVFTLPATSAATDPHGQLELAGGLEGGFGSTLLAVGYNVSAGSTTSYTFQSVARVLLRFTLGGVLSYLEYGTGSAASAVYGASSPDFDAGNVYIVTSAGMSYIARGQASAINIYVRSTYESTHVYNGTLYASRSGNNAIAFFNARLPTIQQGAQFSLGTPTFSDGRGVVWRSPTEIYVCDQGVGLSRITRSDAGSNSWAKDPAAAFRAGPGSTVGEFLDVALHADNRTLFLTTASALYSFDAVDLAFNNGGSPVATAEANTQFRGLSRAPAALPTPSPSVTPSVSPTPSITPTASASYGSSPTPSPSVTASVTPSPVDPNAAARAQAAAAAAQTTNGAVGGVLGAAAFGVALYFVRRHRENKATELRLKRLKASSADALESGRRVYIAGADEGDDEGAARRAAAAADSALAEARLGPGSRRGGGGMATSKEPKSVRASRDAAAAAAAIAETGSIPTAAPSAFRSQGSSGRGLTSSSALAPQVPAAAAQLKAYNPIGRGKSAGKSHGGSSV